MTSGTLELTGSGRQIRSWAIKSRAMAPGLAFVAVGVLLAVLLNKLVPPIGTLTGAVLIGAIAGNAGLVKPGYAPGIRIACRRLLRLGVALLGLRLAFADVLGLGPGVLALVVVLVVVTFVATRWMGRLLGVSEGLSLLIATGFSICGASAVVAMNGVREQEEQEVAKALGLVTLFGSAAMVVLPLLQSRLGLDPSGYGIWAGGSVHEVAQVVAASAPVAGALAIAVAVKLTRVVLLAPMITMVGLVERRKAARAATSQALPPLVPLFVAGFLAMAVVRSVGVLPQSWLDSATFVDGLLLAAAMFGLGTAVRLKALFRSGMRVALLGLLSTLLIATLALAGATLLT